MKEDEELEVVENWKDMNSDKVRLESSLQVATTQTMHVTYVASSRQCNDEQISLQHAFTCNFRLADIANNYYYAITS